MSLFQVHIHVLLLASSYHSHFASLHASLNFFVQIHVFVPNPLLLASTKPPFLHKSKSLEDHPLSNFELL
jgi:hypothetical protein